MTLDEKSTSIVFLKCNLLQLVFLYKLIFFPFILLICITGQMFLYELLGKYKQAFRTDRYESEWIKTENTVRN